MCTSAPTLTVGAPKITATATVNDNAAKTATVTNNGFGYIGAPAIKVTATSTVCPQLPVATAIVANGMVTNVVLTGGTCITKPTLTINPPFIDAKATVTKLGETLSVNLTEKGA